ncbi:hypothetical protein QZH41_002123 [Actinostola sp. cb2023]|nr:hypothetical protein QZH41_002123 [Actinostola sp. cb2023]
MYPGKTDQFLHKYEAAIQRPYGYLFVDLKPNTPEECRLHTNVLPNDPPQTGGQLDAMKTISNFFQRQGYLQSPFLKAMQNLEEQMDHILKDPSVPAEIKTKEYTSLFNRYLEQQLPNSVVTPFEYMAKDMEDLTGDHGVLKTILRSGVGPVVPKTSSIRFITKPDDDICICVDMHQADEAIQREIYTSYQERCKESVKHKFQVLEVINIMLACYENIILDAGNLIKALKYDVNGSLKYRWRRGDAKWIRIGILASGVNVAVRSKAIAIDHAHEQHNKIVKGDGGAIGLTENSSELLRWMLSGPELSRMVGDFESFEGLDGGHEHDDERHVRHHEQVQCKQASFENQVKEVCKIFERMGNPFTELSSDLLVINTRDIASKEVVNTVKTIQQVGQQAFNTYVECRLEKREKSLFDPIKKNKLPLFSTPPSKIISNNKQQVMSLKKDCTLFSQLFISCQVRGGDLDEFFSHENHAFPPALYKYGELRQGTKSDLLRCLESSTMPSQSNSPVVNAILLDGAAIVHMLKPGPCKTFQEYGDNVFLRYVKTQLQNVSRVDVIWDEYLADSLKSQTRSKRGHGQRRRVEPTSLIPRNWEEFLRVADNKVELFLFLAELCKAIQLPENKYVISTVGQDVACNVELDREFTGLAPCTQEEADTRLFLHCKDCVIYGSQKLLIRTVDTDVVVIAVAMFAKIGAEELWVAMGTGKAFRLIAIHEVVRSIGPSKAAALPAFHAFTGCDQTSSFAGKGKCSAWETWRSFEEVTPALEALSDSPIHYNAYREYCDEPYDSSRFRGKPETMRLGEGFDPGRMVATPAPKGFLSRTNQTVILTITNSKVDSVSLDSNLSSLTSAKRDSLNENGST